MLIGVLKCENVIIVRFGFDTHLEKLHAIKHPIFEVPSKTKIIFIKINVLFFYLWKGFLADDKGGDIMNFITWIHPFIIEFVSFFSKGEEKVN